MYSNCYSRAYQAIISEIVRCAEKYDYLERSVKLNQREQKSYLSLLQRDMNDQTLSESLLILSKLLEKHHGQKVIILIDEYDVPLAKAFDYGYYDQMVLLIRKLLSYCLKSNTSLQLAACIFQKKASLQA